MKKAFFLAAALGASLLAPAQTAQFSYFSYGGNDTRFDKEIDRSRQYLNPILAGFYPDPSICRKGDTYYLVNSSFSFFPGVPIFTSKDLVNWTQLGHVLDRKSQLPLDRQNVSGGIFAPAITYNEKNKTFYMITTNVGAGNFFVKTKDPAKGWSEPIYLPKVGGIDPSFFFDKDGRGYIVNNDEPIGGHVYEGERSIMLHYFDVEGDSVVGDQIEIVRSGSHVQKNPIWIEGPHLYRIGKYYYLMCAEGGTGAWHSEVIFRSKKPDATHGIGSATTGHRDQCRARRPRVHTGGRLVCRIPGLPPVRRRLLQYGAGHLPLAGKLGGRMADHPGKGQSHPHGQRKGRIAAQGKPPDGKL